MRRLFFADDLPVMLAVHVVRVQGLAPDAPAEALRLPLLEFLARHHRHPPKSGEAHFKAVLADADTAGTLKVEPGSPLLLLEAVIRDDLDGPMLLAWEYYRGEEGFLLPVAPFHF
jgi:DNA-binding GntR family transcriptional regulator